MSRNNSNKEIIHISLGSKSNAITSHLLNLYGLSIVSQYDDNVGRSAAPLCNPNTTHNITSYGGSKDEQDAIYTPRVLIVDEKHNFQKSYELSSSSSFLNDNNNASLKQNDNGCSVPTWNGHVDIMRQNSSTFSSNTDEKYNNNDLFMLHNVASQMAQSARSIYKVPTSVINERKQQYFSSSSMNSNSRHVNWDELDEETEDDNNDDYDEYERQRKERLKLQKEQHEIDEQNNLQKQIDSYWEEKFSSSSSSSSSSVGAPDLRWIDYWMPPYPSPYKNYATELPFVGGTDVFNNNDNFLNGLQYPSSSSDITNKHWKEDILFDNIRKQLELCDTITGFTILTEGYGLYTGLTTSIIQDYLIDECKSSSKFVMHVISADDDDDEIDTKYDSEKDASSWMTSQVKRLRSKLQNGLTLEGLASNSNMYLPLSLPKKKKSSSSLFTTSSQIALALETATLPYRINSNASNIGLCGGYYGGNTDGTDMYGTANSLSFNEYINGCLRPSSSNRHNIIELDYYSIAEQQKQQPTAMTPEAALLQSMLMTSSSSQGLSLFSSPSSSSSSSSVFFQKLQKGTSIERQQILQRVGGHRNNQVRYGTPNIDSLPGDWLQPYAGTRVGGGILTSLSSPIPSSSNGNNYNKDTFNRQLHRHFALSSSLRSPSLSSSSSSSSSNSNSNANQYLTMLMESMGVQYRPEVYVGNVVNQSISNLTNSKNLSSAAGSYWKYLLMRTRRRRNDNKNGKSSTSNDNNNNDMKDEMNTYDKNIYDTMPVLSVLGNTTRIYPYLHGVSNNMKDIVGSSSSRKNQYAGYYNRDVMNSILPEIDDCVDQLEYCMSLSELYMPPIGSGLVDDNDNGGDYYEDNEEEEDNYFNRDEVSSDDED